MERAQTPPPRSRAWEHASPTVASGKGDWTDSPLPQKKQPLKISEDACFSSPKPGAGKENLRPALPATWAAYTPTPVKTPKLPTVQETPDGPMPSIQDVEYMPAWVGRTPTQLFTTGDDADEAVPEIPEGILGISEEARKERDAGAELPSVDWEAFMAAPTVHNTFLQFNSPLKHHGLKTPPKTVPWSFGPGALLDDVAEELSRDDSRKASQTDLPDLPSTGHDSSSSSSNMPDIGIGAGDIFRLCLSDYLPPSSQQQTSEMAPGPPPDASQQSILDWSNLYWMHSRLQMGQNNDYGAGGAELADFAEVPGDEQVNQMMQMAMCGSEAAHFQMQSHFIGTQPGVQTEQTAVELQAAVRTDGQDQQQQGPQAMPSVLPQGYLPDGAHGQCVQFQAQLHQQAQAQPQMQLPSMQPVPIPMVQGQQQHFQPPAQSQMQAPVFSQLQQPQTQLQVQQHLQPVLQSQLLPHLQHTPLPQMQPQMQPHAQPHVSHLHQQLQIQPQVQPLMPQVQQQIQTQLQPQMLPQSLPQMHPQMQMPFIPQANNVLQQNPDLSVMPITAPPIQMQSAYTCPTTHQVVPQPPFLPPQQQQLQQQNQQQQQLGGQVGELKTSNSGIISGNAPWADSSPYAPLDSQDLSLFAPPTQQQPGSTAPVASVSISFEHFPAPSPSALLCQALPASAIQAHPPPSQPPTLPQPKQAQDQDPMPVSAAAVDGKHEVAPEATETEAPEVANGIAQGSKSSNTTNGLNDSSVARADAEGPTSTLAPAPRHSRRHRGGRKR